MRQRTVSVLGSMIVLGWAFQCAQAGVIRSTGKTVQEGSITVVQKTADAAGAATAGAGNASKATAGVLKTGTVAAGKGVVAAPGAGVRGTKAAASSIWKAIW